MESTLTCMGSVWQLCRAARRIWAPEVTHLHTQTWVGPRLCPRTPADIGRCPCKGTAWEGTPKLRRPPIRSLVCVQVSATEWHCTWGDGRQGVGYGPGYDTSHALRFQQSTSPPSNFGCRVSQSPAHPTILHHRSWTPETENLRENWRMWCNICLDANPCCYVTMPTCTNATAHGLMCRQDTEKSIYIFEDVLCLSVFVAIFDSGVGNKACFHFCMVADGNRTCFLRFVMSFWCDFVSPPCCWNYTHLRADI